MRMPSDTFRPTRIPAIATSLVVATLLGLAARPVPAEEPQAPESSDPVATGSGPLVATIVAETLVVERTDEGVVIKRWVPAEQLNVGDQVYYTIRVSNPGKQAVTGVTVTKRLPFGVHYIRGSAVGPACRVEFSVDGGATFSATPLLGASTPGNPARKAQASDYSHVRWLLSRPLAPGATALLRFRATFT